MIQLLLLGPTGIGKTHWGSRLAKALDINFEDLDQALAQKYTEADLAHSLQIWGLSLFYQRSRNLISEYAQKPEQYIIAVGAGTQLAARGNTQLTALPSLCLWAPPDWLWKKNQSLRHDPRSLDDFTLIEYHPMRQDLYHSCNHLIDLSRLKSEQVLPELLKHSQ